MLAEASEREATGKLPYDVRVSHSDQALDAVREAAKEMPEVIAAFDDYQSMLDSWSECGFGKEIGEPHNKMSAPAMVLA